MHLLYFLPVLENILVFFFPPAPSSLNSTHQRVNKVEQGKLKGLKHQNVQGWETFMKAWGVIVPLFTVMVELIVIMVLY